jgi:hypothetical protein
MSQAKVYNLIVGQHTYIKADTDVCKILKQMTDTHQHIGVFKQAEVRKGKRKGT